MKREKICVSNLCKNIAYILIPILLLILVTSIISVIYIRENTDINSKTDKEFFDTKVFSSSYMYSINKALAIIMSNNLPDEQEYDYIEGNYYNYDIQKNVNINRKQGNIFYWQKSRQENFIFLIIDNNKNIAYTNLEHTMNTDTVEEIKNVINKNRIYWNYENRDVRTTIKRLSIDNIKYTADFEEIESNDYSIYTALIDDLIYRDEYYTSSILNNWALHTHKVAVYTIPISAVLLLMLIPIIFKGIGKKKGKEGIYLNFFDKIPFELAIGFLACLFTIGLIIVIIVCNLEDETITATLMLIGCIIMYYACILVLETLVKRIKAKRFWKTTLLYMIIQKISHIFKNFNLFIQTLLLYGIFVLVNIVLSGLARNWAGLLWLFAFDTFAFYIITKKVIQFDKIKKAIAEIYNGNTNIKLNENEMKGVLKTLAIQINDIAGGLSNAIKEQLKSERLKTELITNVSHDIKTPLTSIINYVDLLKKEKIENPKVQEYLVILDNKSQRLKKLTEDLVEASKASSGAIKLNIQKISIKELIKQVTGEFEDRFKARGLEEIITLPSENIYIQADSRYMYRVLENLYSNISKYALENSRVYVDVAVKGNEVTIQLKNTSKDKLNISADELMQRFVRGETSRNTEGSGLGLSIATSLTELQGGKFSLYLDGDLFKVTINLSLAQ